MLLTRHCAKMYNILLYYTILVTYNNRGTAV
jgi:hypothetical protein